jgi:hypothetical protein
VTPRVWPKVKKERRKELAKALRARLSERAHGIGEAAEALDVEPEEVVVVMRELRGKKSGRLVSALQRGQTVWRWEETSKPAKVEEAVKPVKPVKPKKGK